MKKNGDIKKISIFVFLILFFTATFSIQVASAFNPTYRYIKWEIVKRKSATDNCSGTYCIQAAELVLLLDGVAVSWPVGTTATNPNGNNPVGEEPSKAIDSNVNTKWLDRNFDSDGGDHQNGSSILLIDTGAGTTVTFNGYKWATANDETVRDPISWRLYGSRDNSEWILLDQKDGVNITNSRNTYTSNYSAANNFSVPEIPHLLSLITLAGGVWFIVQKNKQLQNVSL